LDPLILDPHHTCIHWQLLTILTGRPRILLAHLGISRSGTAVGADYHWWRKVANIAWLPACLGDGNQPAIDISANEALITSFGTLHVLISNIHQTSKWFA